MDGLVKLLRFGVVEGWHCVEELVEIVFLW